MTNTTECGRVTRINDIDLYCEIRGDGDPLVLLHGFTGCGRDWKHVFDLERLAGSHRVITPDLRGHGNSSNPAGTLTHRQCAEDLIMLLDHLDLPRIKAIGLSFGANVLLHLATRYLERVEAMVLVAPATYYASSARAIMRNSASLDPSPEALAAMRETHRRGDEQIRALCRQPALFAATFDDMNFTMPYLSTITARTLIVNGDRDPLLPVEQFVEMYRAIEHSALWIVPQGGHGPIFGEWRDAFATTAMGFLTRPLEEASRHIVTG
jgi:pimeloyl-ACP methyl ester carboxylesterase